MTIRRMFALVAITVVALGGALIGPSVTSPAPAGAYAYYGALALSPSTGATGRAWDFPDQASASNGAVNACGYNDCRVVATMTNGCGAIASSPTYWGFGASRYLASAQSAALYSAGAGSQVYDWVCTSGHGG